MDEAFLQTFPALARLGDQAVYGLLIYTAAVLVGCAMIGKPLWGLLLALIGWVPALLLAYPQTGLAVVALAAWLVFRRYGWRHSLATAALLFVFVTVLWAELGQHGWALPVALPITVYKTFALALLAAATFALLRMLRGRSFLEFVGGYGWHAESARLRQRQEHQLVTERLGQSRQRLLGRTPPTPEQAEEAKIRAEEETRLRRLEIRKRIRAEQQAQEGEEPRENAPTAAPGVGGGITLEDGTYIPPPFDDRRRKRRRR